MRSDHKGAVTAVQATIIVAIVVIASVGVGYYLLKEKDGDEGTQIGLGTVLEYSISKEYAEEISSGVLSFEAIGQNSDSLFLEEDYRITHSSLGNLVEHKWVDTLENNSLQVMDLSGFTLKDSENMETIDGNISVDVYIKEWNEDGISTCYVGEYKGFEMMYELSHEYSYGTSKFILTEHNLIMQSSYIESDNIGKSFTYSVEGSDSGTDITGTCLRTFVGDAADGDIIFSIDFDISDNVEAYNLLCAGDGIPVDFIDTKKDQKIETIDGELMAEIWGGQCNIDIYSYSDLKIDCV